MTMPRILVRRVTWIFVILAWSSAAFPSVVLRDVNGTELRIDHPPQRIVSLSPHTTELLYAVGAGERIVGAVEFSDYPPQAQRIPRVGGYENLDVERIVSLKPDLIIGWASGNPPAVLARLRTLGLPLFVTEPQSLDDVAGALESLGRLTGNIEAGSRAAAAFRARAGELRKRYAGRPPVRVFYQVWSQPLMTVNDRQLIGDVLRMCGGRNIFGTLSALAPTVDVEAVLDANPEVIMTSMESGAPSTGLDNWRRWPRLLAVANDNLFVMPPDLLLRHAPRILDGAQLVCEKLDQARAKRHP